ncbi:MAG: phasin family protein [Methylocystis sp.]|uniref:phasin family protein n=1 Tax=Methylocystis sp. TaxID=1911079 RepID=UPI0039289F90
MANPQNNPPKPKPAEAKRSAPSVTEIDAEAEVAPTGTETVIAESAPVVVEALKPPAEKAPSTALAIAVEIKSAEPEAFDPAAWSQKSIDLWAENATAVLDFAERLANAKSIDEVTSLQSRFVNERFDTLLRHSNDLLTLAQRLFGLTITPLFGVRAA